MKKGFLSEILRSDKTVFSFKDFTLLWGDIDVKTAKARVNYYTQHNELYHIRRGFYAKDKNYNKYELATKIFTPSYVSFETVLGAAGVTFQLYGQIFVASYQSKTITCDGQVYSFKTLKESILTNNAGLEVKTNYSLASTERAFLDVVYLNNDYHFDNLSALDWEKIFEILPIYGGNRRMGKMVNKYYKTAGKTIK